MSRRLAREVSFRALFQLDFNNGEEREVYEDLAIEENVRTHDEEDDLKLTKNNISYVEETVKGTRENLEKIDELITSNLKKGWQLSRVAAADRNILRLAVYEMKFAEPKIPKAVAINEAVELAKKYGTDDSSKFVNGILVAIAD